MNRRIIFFTEKDARHGFSLAGFEQHVCTSENLSSKVEQFIRNPEYGLFVIDERLVTEHTESQLREIEKDHDLIFVILPPPLKTPTIKEDYAVRLLRKALGYHVQLNI
jgi:V/A-type H+-transporting ATPase subunit F